MHLSFYSTHRTLTILSSSPPNPSILIPLSLLARTIESALGSSSTRKVLNPSCWYCPTQYSTRCYILRIVWWVLYTTKFSRPFLLPFVNFIFSPSSSPPCPLFPTPSQNTHPLSSKSKSPISASATTLHSAKKIWNSDSPALTDGSLSSRE